MLFFDPMVGHFVWERKAPTWRAIGVVDVLWLPKARGPKDAPCIDHSNANANCEFSRTVVSAP
jgi:hypothetical protein